jgi:PAS domain S-box-containing protein
MTSEIVQDFKGQQHFADFPRSEVAADRISQIYDEIAGSVLHGFAIMQDGKIALANKAFAALAGLSVSDIVGSPVRQFISIVRPEDRPQLMTQLQLQSTVGHVPSSFVARTNTADEPSRWLEFYANLTTFRGKPAIQTSVIDITEHKQAMEKIRRLSRALEQSPAMVIITDIGGNIVYVNPKFAELTGFDGQEIIGSDMDILLPMDCSKQQQEEIWSSILEGDCSKQQQEEIWSSILEGREWNGEVCVGKQGGGHFWAHTSISPLLDDRGQVSHVIMLQEDITEQRLAEQAIRDSEQRFRSVTETAADAIIIANQDGGIEYWNRAAADMFGYAREDVIGKPISMLVPERMQATLHRVWEQLILVSVSHFDGMATSMHAVRADGGEFPVEVSHATWLSDGRRNFSVIIRDVAEARSAQRRLEAKSRLAAVGQLASGIAHDFNNILGTIILQSEMLLNGPHLSTKDRERINVIIEQSQHAASLTDQIMDFSDRTIVELEPLDLGPLVQSMKSRLEQMLPESIKVHLSIDEGSFIAKADKARLQQVFTNLALNSRDAMPGGGDIVIGISRKTVSLGGLRPFREMGPGEWIRIQVSDTGEGIKPEHQARVFEPFFTTKPPGEGSGLGLAQVYGIIKQHNGFIDVRSQRGLGATFTIHLPECASIPGDDEALEEEHAVHGEEETILVVDDDASTRDAIREILNGLNYEVLLASDGMEAMDLLKQERAGIDLVLTDMIVPKTGTGDLHVRLRETGMQIPTIVMTGHPLGREDREQLIMENLDWIQKPFSSDTLSRKVRQALDFI